MRQKELQHADKSQNVCYHLKKINKESFHGLICKPQAPLLVSLNQLYTQCAKSVRVGFIFTEYISVRIGIVNSQPPLPRLTPLCIPKKKPIARPECSSGGRLYLKKHVRVCTLHASHQHLVCELQEKWREISSLFFFFLWLRIVPARGQKFPLNLMVLPSFLSLSRERETMTSGGTVCTATFEGITILCALPSILLRVVSGSYSLSSAPTIS